VVGVVVVVPCGGAARGDSGGRLHVGVVVVGWPLWGLRSVWG
jgi:hypothetical protein